MEKKLKDSDEVDYGFKIEQIIAETNFHKKMSFAQKKDWGGTQENERSFDKERGE